MDPAKAAFFIRTGPNVFAPTNMTIGPWDANSQHGGPPAALAAHMIVDSSKADGKFLLSKFSFHLYRPVPVAKQLRVQVKPIQQSKNVWHVEAVLTTADEVDSKLVARGEGLLLRELGLKASEDAELLKLASGLCDAKDAGGVPPYPHQLADLKPQAKYTSWMPNMPTYNSFCDLNAIRGNDAVLDLKQPSQSEIAARVEGALVYAAPRTWELVRDAEPAQNPPVRLNPTLFAIILADSANGISGILPFGKWIFTNADYTMQFYRAPRLTGWDGDGANAQPLGFKFRSRLEPANLHGLSFTEILDTTGLAAISTQHLCVRPPGGISSL